jgi:Fe-S cluster assembly iron-binding protein IscA
MPAITRRATERLVQTRKSRGFPDTYTARLSRREGKLVLDFTDRPGADDRVSAEGGLQLLLDPAVAADLDGALVDVREQDGKERLVLLRSRSKE